MTNSTRGAALFLGAWLAVVLFTASQYSLIYTASGGSAHWLGALQVSVLQWLPWIIVGPLVIALARRFPLRRPHWPRHAAIHMIATLVVVAIVIVLGMMVTRITGGKVTRAFGAEYLRNLHSVALVYWLLVAGTQVVSSFGRMARLEVELADARLAALQAQLHPHFLFNTLHAVSSLIADDPEAAEDMLAALSDLLRTTLGRGQAREVALRDEIDFLERYLAIQKIRLGDRLQVTVDVPPDTVDVLVPSFAIQPLVENAIRYAIAPRRAPGHLEIRAGRADQWLRVTVADDGPGPAADARPGGWGIGLENTRQRLAHLYGAQHRFTVSERPSGGTTVTIEILARTAT